MNSCKINICDNKEADNSYLTNCASPPRAVIPGGGGGGGGDRGETSHLYFSTKL